MFALKKMNIAGCGSNSLQGWHFMKAYKKKCAELGCEVSKIIKEKYETFGDEGEPIDKFHFWEEMGWQGVRALTDSLRQVK